MLQQRFAKRRIWAALFILVAMFAVKVRTQAGVVTNQDIVKMVAAGLTEQVILNAIRQAPRRDFDLSPMALIDLKTKKVSDAIIAEMQKTSKVTVAAPAVSGPPSPSTSLTREQAAELIRKSPLFTTVETTILKLALNCSPGDPSGRYGTRPGESDADYFRRMQAELVNPSIPQDRDTQGSAMEALRSTGLTTTRQSRGCGVDNQRMAVLGTITALTAEGREASKQWRQVDADTWELPMGRRSVVAVTGIKGDSQTAAAEFSWRWGSPQPGITAGSRTVTATALFEKYDDGWRLNTSLLRDYFYDGWGRMTVPPIYRGPATPSSQALATPGASVAASADTQRSLTGKWSGDGSDSTGPGRLEWDVNQSGTSFSGRLALSDVRSGISAIGSITGTVGDSTITFTMTIPRGALPGRQRNCEGLMRGSANLGASQLEGTYEGTLCGSAVTQGRFALRRQ